jgi:hypothetical protein
VVQGSCARLEALGYHANGSTCYILCSEPCKKHFEEEVQAPADQNAPHQLLALAALAKSAAEAAEAAAATAAASSTAAAAAAPIENTVENAAEFSAAVASAPGVPDEAALLSDSTGAPRPTASISGASSSAETAAAAMQAIKLSVDHGLGNCSLDDIRSRLGFPKTVIMDRTGAIVEDASIASTSTTTTSSSSSAPGSAPVSVASSAAGEASSSTTGGTGTAPAPAPAPPSKQYQFPFKTVSLVNTRTKVRFLNLEEIPNFSRRLGASKSRIQALLYKVIHDIKKHEAVVLEERAARQGVSSRPDLDRTQTQSTAAAAAAAGYQSASSDDERIENIDEERFLKTICEYKGVSDCLSHTEIARIFLKSVSSMAQALKFELYPLAQLLGLSFVMPLVRVKNSDFELNAWEPKFG